MKSVVEVVIHRPQSELAALFSDPRENVHWMEDVERIESVRGDLGAPGSVYRMVPKKQGKGAGQETFVATVVERQLPTTVKLALDAPSVSVAIDDEFVRVSDATTKLISEETFTFKGFFGKIVGLFAGPAIRRAHRGHMESFKRFAEGAA